MHIFGIADLTQLPNVTITWYRLSRLKVYPSHTLSTFDTLNQNDGLFFYALLEFLTPLIKNDGLALHMVVDIFEILAQNLGQYRFMRGNCVVT